MAVIESIRKWLKTYPELSGWLDVDFLGEDVDTYSVDSIPCPEIIKQYRDGSTLKQFQFAVSSRRFYEQNIKTNSSNLQFFEDLTNWIEKQKKMRNLPKMDEGKTALKIIVTSTAYPFIISEDGKARYQVQMRLEYFNKGV